MKTKFILLLSFAILIPVLFTSCKKNDGNIDNLPTVSTIEVTDIQATYAKSGGNITDDGGYSVTERGVVWSKSTNPSIQDNKTSDGAGAGSFISTATDLTPETDYYLRAYATNNKGTAYGSSFVFKTTSLGLPCPGMPTVTDIDGNVYNTVLIGEQCWMKENLKTTTYNNGTAIPNVTDNNAWLKLKTGAYVWYDNDITWKDKYGALYNWYVAVDPNVLCPTGWHLPSHNEWTTLIDHIGGTSSHKGNKLKSCRQVNSPLGGDCNTNEHPRWEQHSTHYGTDDYGFSGLPGGFRYFNGTFFNIGKFGYWWSSTEYSSSRGWFRYLYEGDGYVTVKSDYKQLGLSIRCLRD